uniref:Putative secreted protein n=1 Tax=Anopheles marajoara TaxID=58244 RepID=A0A2M4C6M6_9DIPT
MVPFWSPERLAALPLWLLGVECRAACFWVCEGMNSQLATRWQPSSLAMRCMCSEGNFDFFLPLIFPSIRVYVCVCIEIRVPGMSILLADQRETLERDSPPFAARERLQKSHVLRSPSYHNLNLAEIPTMVRRRTHRTTITMAHTHTQTLARQLKQVELLSFSWHPDGFDGTPEYSQSEPSLTRRESFPFTNQQGGWEEMPFVALFCTSTFSPFGGFLRAATTFQRLQTFPARVSVFRVCV